MTETHKIPAPAMQVLHTANGAANKARQNLQTVVVSLFAALDIDGQLVSYDSESNEIEVERAEEDDGLA